MASDDDPLGRLMEASDLTPEKIGETVDLVGQTADAVLGHEEPSGERRGGMLARFTNLDHFVLGVPVNGHREGGVAGDLREIKRRMGSMEEKFDRLMFLLVTAQLLGPTVALLLFKFVV